MDANMKKRNELLAKTVIKGLDEPSVGVKGQSNLEIARTPRKAFRCRVGWSSER